MRYGICLANLGTFSDPRVPVELGLAAEEMRHASDVEPKPIIAVGIERRTITDADPRKRAQGFARNEDFAAPLRRKRSREAAERRAYFFRKIVRSRGCR